MEPFVQIVFTDEIFDYLDATENTFYFGGNCCNCENNYFITIEGESFSDALDIADEIVDGLFDWWFVDGTWLCNVCS